MPSPEVDQPQGGGSLFTCCGASCLSSPPSLKNEHATHTQQEVHNDSLQDRLVWPDDNWDDFGRRKVDDGSRIVSDGDGGISGARGSNGRLRGLLNGEHHGRGIDAKISGEWNRARYRASRASVLTNRRAKSVAV